MSAIDEEEDENPKDCSEFSLCTKDIPKWNNVLEYNHSIEILFWFMVCLAGLFILALIYALYSIFSNSYNSRKALESEGWFGMWTKKHGMGDKVVEEARPEMLLLPLQRPVASNTTANPFLTEDEVPARYPKARTSLLPEGSSQGVRVTVEKQFVNGPTLYINKTEAIVNKNEVVKANGDLDFENIAVNVSQDMDTNYDSSMMMSINEQNNTTSDKFFTTINSSVGHFLAGDQPHPCLLYTETLPRTRYKEGEDIAGGPGPPPPYTFPSSSCSNGSTFCKFLVVREMTEEEEEESSEERNNNDSNTSYFSVIVSNRLDSPNNHTNALYPYH